MDFNQILNLGTPALFALIVLDKFGILDKLPFLKGKNGKDNKTMASEVADLLGTNHLHELIPTLKAINDTLIRLERSIEKHDEKEMPVLTDITKSLTYLEGRLNGKKHE